MLSSFEMHMGRRPKVISSNLAIMSNQTNLSWDKVKLAKCLDQKRLVRPPSKSKQMHDMKAWSEDEVVIKRRKPRDQQPEILNLDSDMPEGQASQIKQLKKGIQNNFVIRHG